MTSIHRKNIPAPLVSLYESAGRIDGETIWLDETGEAYQRAVRARHRLARSNPELFPKEESRPAPQGTATATSIDGPKMWAELHTHPAPTREWFETWLSRIPCGRCKATFTAILLKFPPDFSTLQAFRECGYLWHAEVDLELGRVPMGREAAGVRWGWEV